MRGEPFYLVNYKMLSLSKCLCAEIFPNVRSVVKGMVWLACYSDIRIVEDELLPLCWEELSHKYAERRLLVTELCCALCPYLSVRPLFSIYKFYFIIRHQFWSYFQSGNVEKFHIIVNSPTNIIRRQRRPRENVGH